jgi:hypothetical protein
LGGLGERQLSKKEKFLECRYSPKLLLELEEVKRFLRFEVGNGEDIHLWLDSWHPYGVLLENYGYMVVYDAQSRVEAKLSSVIFNGKWYWRPARSDDLVEIQSKLYEVRLGLQDKPLRTASRKGVYVSAET